MLLVFLENLVKILELKLGNKTYFAKKIYQALITITL